MQIGMMTEGRGDVWSLDFGFLTSSSSSSSSPRILNSYLSFDRVLTLNLSQEEIEERPVGSFYINQLDRRHARPAGGFENERRTAPNALSCLFRSLNYW